MDTSPPVAVTADPIVGGWNDSVRRYRPGPEILDGICTLPPALA